MQSIKKKRLGTLRRILVEAGSIMFLFYSNLLMGEFIQSGPGEQHGLLWAVANIFTATNFAIAVASSLIGYLFFEFLRKRL